MEAAPGAAQQQAGSGGHLPALDGVRGVAILWVVLHNLSLFDSAWAGNGLARVLIVGVDAGWAAVTLFFALSGFLITGILLDSRDAPDYYRSFYARRVLRIFPLYYGVLLAAFVLWPLFAPLPAHLAADRPHQVWLWTYLSNWTLPYGQANTAFPHFWSLAVEEQFYLLWPFLLHRRDPRAVLRLSLALAAVSLLVRVAMLAGGAPPESLYAFSVCRMDALALGGAAAAALRMPFVRAKLRALLPRLAAAGAGLVLFAALVGHGLARLNPWTQTLGYSLLAVGFSLLILALAEADAGGDQRWWARLWRVAPLRLLAKYSYGMYVFHKILGDAFGKGWLHGLDPALQRSLPVHLAYMGLGVLASLAVAMLSYHLIEKRFLQLKPLFTPHRAVPAAAST
jgi:peptidoglycan/LPS O-acetylase OafA/YrhL